MTTFQATPPATPWVQVSGLIEPAWLQQHLAEVNLFDASFAMPGNGNDMATAFRQRHIPQAQFFDLENASDPQTSLPHMLPRLEDFADYMQSLGFDERKATVIYDDGTYAGATRLWWMLRVFGYDNIALLNGGLPGWEAAQLPVTAVVSPPHPGCMTPVFRPELVWTKDHVIANLDHGQAVLLDARAAPRFRGMQDEPRPGLRRGHIPGALNLPWSELVDPASKRFWPVERLRKIFSSADVRPGEPITTTCGSGVTACVLAFGLFLLGRADIPVYDGSWAEWGKETSTPVMMGPPQRLHNIENIPDL